MGLPDGLSGSSADQAHGFLWVQLVGSLTGDTCQRLETMGAVTVGRCYWHLASRGQGLPSTPYTEQRVTTENYLAQHVSHAETDKS